MNIFAFFFILFIIAIPPTIAILFFYDKKEISEKFNKARKFTSKHKR